jgi:Holliday junction resolvase RusA-like endonuclease
VSPIILPFPPSSLSGHAKGHWRAKAAETKKYRELAYWATRGARPVVPATGDIQIHVHFVPPDRRSDRGNMPVRMKAYFDGLADGLAVNDRRFVPSFTFAEPEKPGRVEVTIQPQESQP